MTGKEGFTGVDQEQSGIRPLSDSGRLSLSDITAATLGNLADDTQWTETVTSDYDVTGVGVSFNQTSSPYVLNANTITYNAGSINSPQNHVIDNILQGQWEKHDSNLDGPYRCIGEMTERCDETSLSQWSDKRTDVTVDHHVLRPWEGSSQTITTVKDIKQPPSYHESVKRKWGNHNLHDSSPEVTKRQRCDPDSSSNQVLPVKIPTLNLHSFSNSQLNGNWSFGSQEFARPIKSGDVTRGNFLTSLQQASRPVVETETQPRAIRTEQLLKTEHNRMNYTVTDSNIQYSDMNSHGSQLLPLSSIPSNNIRFTSARANSWQSEVKRPVPVPSICASHASQTTSNTSAGFDQTVNSSLLAVPNVHSSLHGMMRQANTVHPNKIQGSMLPFIVPMSPNENQPLTINVPPLQNKPYLCEPGTNATPNNALVKVEPVTPIRKGLHARKTAYENSPATDSRFSESLSSLLGSPPPDSPLSKNPYFGDLQRLLSTECKREIVPQTLFGVEPKIEEIPTKDNVFTRERNIQDRFTSLQSECPEEVRQLSGIFRYQSALIETERFRTLHETQYPGSYRDSVNGYYDDKLHKVMDRVEKSVELLEKSNKENKPKHKKPKPRPHLSRSAVQMMDRWYNENREHPYPDITTIEMMADTGNINLEQVKKWFANKRNRNQNTRSLTEIAIQKRKLGQLAAKKDTVH